VSEKRGFPHPPLPVGTVTGWVRTASASRASSQRGL
jgi:hypothetical protein